MLLSLAHKAPPRLCHSQIIASKPAHNAFTMEELIAAGRGRRRWRGRGTGGCPLSPSEELIKVNKTGLEEEEEEERKGRDGPGGAGQWSAALVRNPWFHMGEAGFC